MSQVSTHRFEGESTMYGLQKGDLGIIHGSRAGGKVFIRADNRRFIVNKKSLKALSHEEIAKQRKGGRV